MGLFVCTLIVCFVYMISPGLELRELDLLLVLLLLALREHAVEQRDHLLQGGDLRHAVPRRLGREAEGGRGQEDHRGQGPGQHRLHLHCLGCGKSRAWMGLLNPT